MTQNSTRRLPELVESILDPDPIRQFLRWHNDAVSAGLPEPNAMTLATAERDGRPSARIVLLKRVESGGFQFFSNYQSRKGKELEENPHAALVFHWEELGRQVRVEGIAERLSGEESDKYFASRPVDNNLSTLASLQGEVVSRQELDRRFEQLRGMYRNKQIPRPPHWGGYRVTPERMEFWQRRFARLNDRILYRRGADRQWEIVRLSP